MNTNKRNYIDNFNKNNYKMYQFRVKKENENLIKFLDELDNRNGYINNVLEKELCSNIYTLKELKQIIKPILNKYGIFEIYLFGSYSRGEANNESDIDIFCEKGNIKNLIDFGFLIDELESKLNKNVDIIFNTSEINESIKMSIMEDLIKLC